MKKKILVGLLAALAAPGGAVYWYGRETENAFQALATDFGRSAGAQVTIKRYERGWLGARAETEIALQGMPATLTLAHAIDHGPVDLGRWLQGELDLELFQARVRSELTGLRLPAQNLNLAFPKPPLVADTVVGFSGALESRLHLAASRDLAPWEPPFQWAAGSGTLVASPDLKRYELDATLPSLRLAGEPPIPAALELRNLRVRSQMAEGAHGYSFGTTTLDLGRLSFGAQANATALSFKATTKPAGPHLELVAEYRAGELEIGGQKAGPAEIAVEVRKLDLASLARFREELKEIYGRKLPEQQAALMAAGKSLALVTALAEKSPELEVTRLSLKTGSGEITGRASLVLDGSRSDVRTNPMRLLTALRGDAEMYVPAPLLRPLVAPLVQQDLAAYRARGVLSDREMAALRGDAFTRVVDRAMPVYLARHDLGRWLQSDGERYRLKAALRHGQFLVNDRPWTAQTARLP